MEEKRIVRHAYVALDNWECQNNVMDSLEKFGWTSGPWRS